MTTPEKPKAVCYTIETPGSSGFSLTLIIEVGGKIERRIDMGETDETTIQVHAQHLCTTKGWAYSWDCGEPVRETNTDPRLTNPIHLLRRRTEGGEHLCVFCIHGRMCEIASVARRFETLMPIISGCAGFERPSDD